MNRFGVYRKAEGYIHSNHFRTMEQWGHVFAVGTQLGDNFKLGLGYRLNPGWSDYVAFDSYTPGDAKSSINASFLLSGRPVDLITFDLFYSVIGHDADTSGRLTGNLGYNQPTTGGSWKTTDYWRNIAGVYVGVNGIENLAISGGYTASFNVYDTGSFVHNDGDIRKSDPVTYKAPIYSGVDLRVGYSGIDRIGLKFNNNVSFASVAQKDLYDDAAYTKELILGFDEKEIAAPGVNVGWFNWRSVLQAQLGFIEGVGLEVALLNNLAVTTTNTNTTKKTPQYPVAGDDIVTDTVKSKVTATTNDFRATVGAKYGAGNVSLGIALYFQWTSTLSASESETTKSTTDSTKSDSGVKTTSKSNNDVVKFGIPVTFSVSF
jgi:hypothetical protein